MGLRIDREVTTQGRYRARPIAQFRLDMVVEGRLAIEIKSCAKVGMSSGGNPLNYLRATKYPIGLLLHYGLKPAFYRYVCTPTD